MHAARIGSCAGGLYDWRSLEGNRRDPVAKPVSQPAAQSARDQRPRGSIPIARVTRESEWGNKFSAGNKFCGSKFSGKILNDDNLTGIVGFWREATSCAAACVTKTKGLGERSEEAVRPCGRVAHTCIFGGRESALLATADGRKSGKASLPPNRGRHVCHVDGVGELEREESAASPQASGATQLGMDMVTEDDVTENTASAMADENGDGGQNQRFIDALVNEACIWSALNGLLVGDGRLKESSAGGMGMVHAPVTLLPSPFSRALFDEVNAIAPLFNELVDCISQNADFLWGTLASASRADPFTTKLLQIHSTILDEGVTQDIQLGLHRSDYMLHHATNQLLQVELNTISVSFAGLGSQVTKLHKHIVEKNGARLGLHVSGVPENVASSALAEGLATAWKEYGDDSAVVMMVVQPGERNLYDQQWIMQNLWESHGVRFIQRTLTEIYSGATLDHHGSLIVDGQVVSVVYFRAGYAPTDYPSEAEWDARLLMERSKAIKCPSISYHLAGAKKVQQELARPGVVERLIGSAESASALRRFFAGLWSLEGEGSDEIISEAIANPHRFVLKPQREGGGNNLYGDSLREKLIELRTRDEKHARGAYILMQRIEPLVQTSYLIRHGQCGIVDTLSELGIFSTYVRNGEKVVLNKAAGHLLRTKAASSDEGGVAAGFAVLDSPYLV